MSVRPPPAVANEMLLPVPPMCWKVSGTRAVPPPAPLMAMVPESGRRARRVGDEVAAGGRGDGEGVVAALAVDGQRFDSVEDDRGQGIDLHRATADGWPRDCN